MNWSLLYFSDNKLAQKDMTEVFGETNFISPQTPSKQKRGQTSTLWLQGGMLLYHNSGISFLHQNWFWLDVWCFKRSLLSPSTDCLFTFRNQHICHPRPSTRPPLPAYIYFLHPYSSIVLHEWSHYLKRCKKGVPAMPCHPLLDKTLPPSDLIPDHGPA